MFLSGLITFREALEVVLVVGIIISALAHTDRAHLRKRVWQGVTAGILMALVFGYTLQKFFGGFVGKSEQIFEGVLMIVTVAFLTWMIFWVHRQGNFEKGIGGEITKYATDGFGLGIFVLSLVSVLREGVETVLYLRAASTAGSVNVLWGAMLGILIALCIGYLIFLTSRKVNLSLVFSTINVFLILFAAGLLAHGVHEFQEIGWLPVFSFDPLFDFSNFLSKDSVVGGLLRAIFGYSDKPTLLEIISYGGYVLSLFWIEKRRK